nr:MAG TPA: hypothetical protein [Caudoviricetes sp.]
MLFFLCNSFLEAVARESSSLFPFLLQNRYRPCRSMVSAFPYFFLFSFYATRSVPVRNFLCKGSFWRVKPLHEPALKKAKDSSRFTKSLPFLNTEPHICLPLPAHC